LTFINEYALGNLSSPAVYRRSMQSGLFDMPVSDCDDQHGISFEYQYYFNFLSPSNYDDYFAYIRDGRLIQGLYESELDISLEARND
jgi:hypothetical protein